MTSRKNQPIPQLLKSAMSAARDKTDTQHAKFCELLCSTELEWHRVLECAGEHLITPSLYLSIVEKKGLDCLEDSVLEALRVIYEANVQRNQSVIANFEHFCSVLNAIDVYPLPLKGVALLAERIYLDPGERIVSDIDVLIRPSELEKVLAALSGAKYLQLSNLFDPISLDCPHDFFPIDVRDFRNQASYFHHHIPPVRIATWGIKIDIHTRVCFGSDRMSLSLNELVDQDVQLMASGHSRFKRPMSLFHLLHNFYHSQVQDKFNKLQLVDYRHLIDVKYLLQSCGTNTRGDNLRQELIADAMRISSEQGLGREFSLYLSQLETHCGVAIRVASSVTADSIVEERPESLPLAALGWSVRCKRVFWSVSIWFTRRRGILFLTKWLRDLYGPIPFHSALYKYSRYQGMKLVRLVMK